MSAPGVLAQSINTVFLGTFGRANFQPINQSHKRIFDTTLTRISDGRNRTALYIEDYKGTGRYKKLNQEVGLKLFGTTSADDLAEISSRGGQLSPDLISFLFVSLDDVVLLSSKTSLGLNKISVYVSLSVYLFSFADRQVIYAGQFVVPVEGATRDEDVWKYGESLISQDSLKEAFQGLAANLLAASLNSTGLEKSLTSLSKGNTASFQGTGFISVDVDRAINPRFDIPEKYRAQISSEWETAYFRRLTSYLMVARLSKEVPMVPAFARDPSLGISAEYVSTIIHRSSPILEALTGYQVQVTDKSETGCRSLDKVCLISANPFPAASYLIRLRLAMRQSGKEGAGGVRNDTFSVSGNVVLVSADDGTEVCLRVPGKPPSFQGELPREYHVGSETKVSSSGWFNALFIGLTKGAQTLSLVGPSGAYPEPDMWKLAPCSH